MSNFKTIIPDWDVPADVVAAITTRTGGVSRHPYASLNLSRHVGDCASDVDENLRLLTDQYPQQLQWQWLQQTHGGEARRVDKLSAALAADGLSTSVPGLACCLLTADCLPVFIAARDGGEVAMAHAGWRGLVAGILEHTVASCSTPAREMVAWLGPAIGACHFEVGSDVKESFIAIAQSPEDQEALEKCFTASENPGKYLSDLYGIAKFKLTQLGIDRICGGDYCTFCEPELFYSFRRDGITGRMVSIIYIRS